ncbi:sugar O-acyltransferase (sialic acid O-acetyltransferase NeuD family) [Arthrobacter pigmenti]|uniref:Sugar O-acyltransferase (Sialic acid O-acetyltransferase NeuD family) n=1 Tax=Arthrobacter pigmenti TaxID=271432 RepID=A0A846RV59_9MICC|nr:transferase [Arthrobacter pigmenti]NJC22906.1 sugar O-acyltransferase (sialic acid O-acetyltransferase NeuD family) [Arthrobacter pigmenti]
MDLQASENSDLRSPGTRQWIIFGAGGHARSLFSVIRGRGDTVAGVVGDGGGQWKPVQKSFSNDDDAIEFALNRNLSVCIGIGANHVRWRLAELLLEALPPENLVPLVAHSATVDPTADLAPLTQILEHAHVGPGATVGAATIVNTSAVVEHDAATGDSCHLAPGAMLLGEASIAHRVFVGSGARVLPRISVADDVILGAGAVATKDLPGSTTYVGVPAAPTTSMKGITE